MTERIDILVSEDVWGAAFEQLTTRYQVVREPGLWQDPERLAGQVRRSRALVVRNRTRVDRALLTAGERLTVVARAGVGLDNIDLPAADEAGVVVTAPLGANAVSVAEHTLGLALTLARGTVRLDADCRAGGWRRAPGRELRGGTWGLLGCGATARACGELAAALGMRVLAHDPYLDPAHPALATARIELAPLERVVAEADVLSCHLPATADTTGLVNADLLARMRPSALFVNAGRGEVVDEDALADALEAGTLGGAALDVRASEPPRPGRLEKLDNVVLTPHIAGITAQSQALIARTLADDLDAVLSGGRASSSVGTAKEARS
ncbi:hydroxyacid dehydrogenase [Prauserella cavernicola]|uniref:Hydroxyacid dehydrogenase n=1 Tax=Prauserella cavernicola TaxID=2800127 RepID=A0A934QPE7_9PSEU|nr:hydroxyacid dehydrogenase [Prauserella cavernicola]MBK1783661.1 hydroxyacid dehydrogenase [Prauserella cavernicola]